MRLRQLAKDYNIPELRDLANELYRSTAVKRAPRKSQPLTAVLAEEIRRYAKDNPSLHQQDVANHFDINHGRVSEALNYEK